MKNIVKMIMLITIVFKRAGNCLLGVWFNDAAPSLDPNPLKKWIQISIYIN